ncbi:MAG: multiprotein bridging factor aMBF1 [Archaeoglobaceae archaeon]|nr:multiprotein bridging factor aMBF1 [Archaeoglobaceae archaeon]
MNCEICGKEIRAPGHKIIVEGTELSVCTSCKKYGSENVSAARQVDVKRIIIKRRKPQTKVEFKEELVENYNLIIKTEREKRGWSQEQLAKKIQEKESVIKKIENAEITPEPEIIEKLEKIFSLKLRESIPEVKIDKVSQMTPTLGDIVTVKKKV